MASVILDERQPAGAGSTDAGTRAAGACVSSEQVWQALDEASFAVLSYVTPDGEPRSSGVVYTTVGRRLYVAVAPDSWKARHIGASGRVAVTVPVGRARLLSLLLPIPPVTISFHGRAIVHPAGAVMDHHLIDDLAPLLPPERRAASCIIEVVPEGAFVTYGMGVSLKHMRTPALARARVPVLEADRARVLPSAR
jgi:hypothetical protein